MVWWFCGFRERERGRPHTAPRLTGASGARPRGSLRYVEHPRQRARAATTLQIQTAALKTLLVTSQRLHDAGGRRELSTLQFSHIIFWGEPKLGAESGACTDLLEGLRNGRFTGVYRVQRESFVSNIPADTAVEPSLATPRRFRMATEVCANCGAQCDDVMVCSACKCTPYCGKECQRRHWPKVGPFIKQTSVPSPGFD